MSYKMIVETNKITAEMIADLENQFPFAKNVFTVVDTVEAATEKVVQEANGTLPRYEVVSKVLDVVEDTEKNVYRVVLSIMD